MEREPLPPDWASTGPAVPAVADVAPSREGSWPRLEAGLGLLAGLGSAALLGGVAVQGQSDALPGSYTWLQPLRTLRHVAETPNLPSVAVLAALLGAGSRSQWRATVRRAVAAARATTGRSRVLLPLLAVGVCCADLAAAPRHTPVDALAVAGAAALLAAGWSRRAAVRALVASAVAAFAFTAVCYWFTVVKALTFVGAERWDAAIVAFERELFDVDPYRLFAEWAAPRPGLVALLDRTYFRIFEHMAVASCFLIGRGAPREKHAYWGALALCYFLGAPLYLLMPAVGPVYYDPRAFAFLAEQPLIVNGVQLALYENTAAVNNGKAALLHTWSYIACMPSLHMAHECVMLHYARPSRLFFGVSLLFTLATTASVLVLGWHYVTDLVAGAVLGATAIALVRWRAKGAWRRRIRPGVRLDA